MVKARFEVTRGRREAVNIGYEGFVLANKHASVGATDGTIVDAQEKEKEKKKVLPPKHLSY
jgi:hypothetical protein